jgi:anti-sigma factor RsiW
MTTKESRRLYASGRPVPGLQIDCIEIVELVTDYLEGALDDATRDEMEAHLVLCPPCQNYLDQMRATIDLLGPHDTSAIVTSACVMPRSRSRPVGCSRRCPRNRSPRRTAPRWCDVPRMVCAPGLTSPSPRK